MVSPFFFSIFEGLPRQGPGDDRCTAEACKYILPLPDKPEISEDEDILNFILEETRIFRSYSSEYGYGLFIAEKSE